MFKKNSKKNKQDNLINGKHTNKHNYLFFTEDYIRTKLTPLVPPYIQTYHLTLLTLILSFPMLLSGILATKNISWFWLHPILVIVQFITDVLDGEVGRRRHTGLVRWGFYADHVFDFLFNNCLLIAYSFIFPSQMFQIYVILTFLNLLFLHEAFNSLLVKEVYNRYGYAGFGSTEIRFVIILIDILIILLSPAKTSWIIDLLFLSSIVFPSIVVYKKQKQIWKIDMHNKKLEEQ